jgi:hypothetical protein
MGLPCSRILRPRGRPGGALGKAHHHAITLVSWASSALNYATRGALFATVLADAVDLEGMPRGLIVMLSPDLLFQLVYLRRKELYRTPTFSADHVMVTAAIVLVLEAGNTIMKGNLAG